MPPPSPAPMLNESLPACAGPSMVICLGESGACLGASTGLTGSVGFGISLLGFLDLLRLRWLLFRRRWWWRQRRDGGDARRRATHTDLVSGELPDRQRHQHDHHQRDQTTAPALPGSFLIEIVHRLAPGQLLCCRPVTRPTCDRSRRRSRSRMSTTFWYCTLESPLTITGKSGEIAFCVRTRCSNSPRVTGNASRKICPLSDTVIALVCGLAKLTEALALGRLTLTPCTEAVVMMMKITNNT